MQAAQYNTFGPAREVLKIVDRPCPEPGRGEVLVRMAASGVNPSDVKKRAGWGNMVTPPDPVIPHADGAGVIDAVGTGVGQSWVGRRVWVFNAQGSAGYGISGGPEAGTAAEYAALPLSSIAHLPEAASFAVGACLGIPAITAHYAVFSDGPVVRQTVLVQGGAGAVGTMAIQFAANAGATVIATVSSEEKADLARSCGASHCIDRHEGNVAEQILEIAPDGVDHIIEVDFGANAALDAKILKIGGRIAGYSSPSDRHPPMPYYELQMRGALIRLISNVRIPASSIDNAIEAINCGLIEGTLNPPIAAEFGLSDIAAAHEFLESGASIGNTVVKVAETA
ncbi:MAG: NADPH:quinone reductase [Alphaproteobacteria bacterium]|nr:NADPH:quinone reductase [Alphaproteobacteria bacterium]